MPCALVRKNLPAFLQHLAAFRAKCAFCALQRVAYGIDLAAAFNNAVQPIAHLWLLRQVVPFALNTQLIYNALLVYSIYLTHFAFSVHSVYLAHFALPAHLIVFA
jgi:hypothetical protein